MRNLSQVFESKKNSLGFLRFLFAALVVFSHSFVLGGFGSERILNIFQGSYGELAVDCFFIISGFLITRSYIRSVSISRFLWHRFLRIFPGFWVCLLITILFFAPIVYLATHGNLNNYFQSKIDNPINYIKANFLLRMNQYGVAGLLNNIPFPAAFNGSLWTLIYEFKCYLAIGILGRLHILKSARVFVIGIFIFLWGGYTLESLIPGTGARFSNLLADKEGLRMMMYFFSGSVLFLYSKDIVFSTRNFIFSAVLTLISIICGIHQPIFALLLGPSLSYVIFWLACELPFSHFDRYGDFSYGLYIYAFPIQQILAFFKVNKYGFSVYFLLSLGLTTLLAIPSYRWIEKPSLNLKDFKISSLFNTKLIRPLTKL
ncbi:acyltransferase [Trichocoleus sp. FACHB-591]|uniref:acyltransferase family protein n=1 Tax=Trichocoleus sp. FACHB-591 TaxID=2692872 RepID=UPI0016828E48|nr:acyltransferase [Trichocoleus sp. FACHB-591]MBD2094381.1 acyltransferase [Trichocoleus sp. FACHB-591]